MASLLSYLPLSERRALLDPGELTAFLQRKVGSHLLPRLEQRSLIAEQVRIAIQMGIDDGRKYLEEYIVPYLEGHPRPAPAFVDRLITELIDARSRKEPIEIPFALLLVTLAKLIPECFAGDDPTVKELREAIRVVAIGEDRLRLKEVMLRLRALVLPFDEERDLAAVAAESLQVAADRLDQELDPRSSLSQSLLTPEVVLTAGARLVMAVSLPIHALSLRNVRPEVEIVDDDGQIVRGALEAPALLPRLGPNQKREIPVVIANAALPTSAKVRVRYSRFDLEGVAHSVEVKSEQFSLTFEAPLSGKLSPSNPYVVGGPVQALERIYGRDKEIDRVWQTLTGEQQDNIVLVLGQRRIGKSTLLNAVEKDLRVQRRYITVKTNLEIFRHESSLIGLFGKSLPDRVREALRDAGVEPPPRTEALLHDNPGSAFEDFMGDVDRSLLANDRRLLFIIDELDQLVENRLIGSQAVTLLRSVMIGCKRASFLLAGATEILSRHTATREDRLFRLALEIRLKPLEESAARRLVQEPAGGYYDFTQSAVDLILSESNRQPYLIQYVCRILFQEMIARSVRTVTETDVEEILTKYIVPCSEVFYDFIASIADPENLVLVKALAALQEGNRYVSVIELRREFGRMGKLISRVDLAERLRKLSEQAPLVVERRLTTHQYRLQVGLFGRHMRYISGGYDDGS